MLYQDCPLVKGRNDMLEVWVTIENASRETNEEMERNISGLTADTARFVTQDLVECVGVGNLPDGLPRIG